MHPAPSRTRDRSDPRRRTRALVVAATDDERNSRAAQDGKEDRS
jgi:hypothetical protein